MKIFKEKSVVKNRFNLWKLLFFSLSLIVFSSLSLGAKALANTYYISPTGLNTNSGSETQPFKTIQKAADIVSPGDTVIVKDGTYTTTSEYFATFNRGGNSLNKITFKAENKGGAIIDGLGVSSYTFSFMPGISYINLSGFEIKNFIWGAFNINNPEKPNTNIVISDNHIHDIGRVCVKDEMAVYGRDGAYIHGGKNIIFERNTFHDIGRLSPDEGCNAPAPYTKYYQNHDHGLYIDGSDGIIVRNNIFYKMQRGWGVHVYSSNDSPSFNLSIINNTFADGNPYRDGSHIILTGTLTNVKVQNNIFYNQVMAGISIYGEDFSATNIFISNNLAYTEGGSGGLIVTETPKGVTLLNNLTNTNPKITNSATHDYKLQSDSPAINAGVDLGLATDYLGNPIVGLPDIGAYESNYNATPPVVVPPVVITPPVIVTPVIISPVVVPPVVVTPPVVSSGGGGGGGVSTTYCSAVDYSPWQDCLNNQQLRLVTSKTPGTCTLTSSQELETKRVCKLETVAPSPVITPAVPTPETGGKTNEVIKEEIKHTTKPDLNLTKRLTGQILLQVEQKGQAWYVDPTSLKRYFLADGPSAYSALRQFGLGVKNVDLAKVPIGLDSNFKMTDSDGDGLSDKLEEALKTNPLNKDSDGDGYLDGFEIKNNYNPLGKGSLTYSTSIAKKLSGKIVIQAENRGEAWYINPADGKRYYLANGEAAFQIMRSLSLGISDEDIRKILVDSLK